MRVVLFSLLLPTSPCLFLSFLCLGFSVSTVIKRVPVRLWVDRFAATSRPFDYESLVSALQSGTRLGSLSRVKSSTLRAHQIFIRTSFGRFLHADLSANGFIERTQLWYSGWILARYLLFLGCRGLVSEFDFAPALEDLSDGGLDIVVRSTSKIEFALRGSLTGEESLLSFNSLVTMLT